MNQSDTYGEDDFKLFDFDGNVQFSIKESSPHWIIYNDSLVVGTDKRKKHWKTNEEMRQLLEKAMTDGSGETSFRTKKSGYYAYDTVNKLDYSIDSALVLPSGNIQVSWPALPRGSQFIENNQKKSAEDYKKIIEQLEKEKKEMAEQLKKAREDKKFMEDVIHNMAAQQAQSTVQNPQERKMKKGSRRPHRISLSGDVDMEDAFVLE